MSDISDTVILKGNRKNIGKIAPEIEQLTVCNKNCAYGWVVFPGDKKKYCVTLVENNETGDCMVQVYGLPDADTIVDYSVIINYYKDIKNKKEKFKFKGFRKSLKADNDIIYKLWQK